MSLARKAVIGGLWLGGVSWIDFGASFAGRMVLVRLKYLEVFCYV